MMMSKNWKFVRLRQEFGVAVVVFLLCESLVCWSLNEEGLALLRLKERVVNNPLGALSDWKEDVGAFDHCSWFGVHCSDGKVVVLNLKDLCLEGTLAPELGTLIHIKSIILRNNSFTGIIPEGITELKELEVLDLGFNNLSGPLPPELGSNLSLMILLLDHNELLSSLSPEIYELQKLSETQVEENRLSNAAKSSCKEGFNTWNIAQSENAVQRSLLPLKFSDVPLPPSPVPASGPAASAEPSRDSPYNRDHQPSNNSTRNSSNNTGSPNLPNASVPSPSANNPPSYTSKSNHRTAILAGAIGGAVFLLLLIVGTYLFKTSKVSTVKPWVTGLSGQLQKAFVTGNSSASLRSQRGKISKSF